MLNWVGKRPLSRVPAYPAQHIETFDPRDTLGNPSSQPDCWRGWPPGYPKSGLLFHGDNKEVLSYLLANGFRGRVQLIYIDPPFDSGADYVRRVSLRVEHSGTKIDGEGHTLGEQVQYTDIWSHDTYLQFMFERLLLLRELLADTGSIVLHSDWQTNHHLRCLMDEVFGTENYLNEIIWYYPNKLQGNVKKFAANHNALLWYAKNRSSGNYTFHRIVEERDKPIKVNSRYWDSARGMMATERDEHGKVVYVDRAERVVDDVWGIAAVSSSANQQAGYPTQKPDGLLQRVILAMSNPGDIVLDAFVGSGTTLTNAQALGRHWIGCDINRGAIQVSARRLETLIGKQADECFNAVHQFDDGRGISGPPIQSAFTVWRVNDYDLQIQHNEAVNLACEFIGVEQFRSDNFFNGTLGNALVKIVPFNHPLTPLDLEELKSELDARPDEDRAITLVCLGFELRAQTWVDEWNLLRKGRTAVNRIEVIELRTDARYGGIIRHERARAKVTINRINGILRVEIEDFISPTVIQRLENSTGILKPQIENWRAMVDSVAIDPRYDGEVFNIAVTDAPERKVEFVSGSYELEAPDEETVVAVKIIDMLGEEVLVIECV